MLRIVVCDDDERQCAEIRALAERYITEKNLTAIVRNFSTAFALLSEVERQGAYDIYLLDILMPEMDGIRLGIALRKIDTAGLIVYLSTTRDFALESYAARAFHYLIKPVDRGALFQVLDLAIHELEKSRVAVLHIKTREGTLQLFCGDIYYAELSNRVVGLLDEGRRAPMTFAKTLTLTIVTFMLPNLIYCFLLSKYRDRRFS